MTTPTTRTHRLRRLAATGTALLTAVLLTACADSDGGMDPNMPGMEHGSGSSATDTNFNDADVRFATDMIPHHQQAIAMSQAASTRATNAGVRELAEKIAAAQGPEINTMSEWLRRWGKPLPSEPAMPGMDHSGMPGMDHGGMPGMMTAKEMADMMAASGAAFDRMFLNMMIRHHEGAVEMARTEQQQGRNDAAKQLAGKIVADQTAEIVRMRELLKQVS